MHNIYIKKKKWFVDLTKKKKSIKYTNAIACSNHNAPMFMFYNKNMDLI